MRLTLPLIFSLFLLTGCLSTITQQERTRAEASPEAAFSLGNKLYAQGREREGIEWLQRSAEQGYPKANYALGLLLGSGQYQVSGSNGAEYYLTEASDSGIHQASYKLAEYHRTGTLGEVNIQKAVRFYERAIDQGSMDARKALGVMYLKGIGVEQDRRKARRLLSVFD